MTDVTLTVSLQELDWICCGLDLLRKDFYHPPGKIGQLYNRLEVLAFEKHKFPPPGARDPDVS